MGLFKTKEEIEEIQKAKELAKYYKDVVEPMWRDIAIVCNGGQIPRGSQLEGLNTNQIRNKIADFIEERYKEAADFAKYVKCLHSFSQSEHFSKEAREGFAKGAKDAKIYLEQLLKNLSSMQQLMEKVPDIYNKNSLGVVQRDPFGSISRETKIRSAKIGFKLALNEKVDLMKLEQHKMKFYPPMIARALSEERTGMHFYDLNTFMIAPTQTNTNTRR